MALQTDNTIAIFGESVTTTAEYDGINLNTGNGSFYSETDWTSPHKIRTRLFGNVSGVADAGVTNTALRQATVMACTLANILSIRNKPSGSSTYGGNFGTQLEGSETYAQKVENMSSIFSNGNFLIDGEVVTAKIADSNVTTSKIKDLNVTTEKLAELGVTTPKIANASVTTIKINDSAVTTSKINNGSITQAKLANTLVSSTPVTTGGIEITNKGLTVRFAQNSDNQFGINFTGTVNTIQSEGSFASGNNYLATVIGTSSAVSYSSGAYFNNNTLTIPGSLNISDSGNITTDGNIQCNSVNTASDIKYKSDLKKLDIDGVTDFVNSIQTYSYDFKKDDVQPKRMIGMIAQDLQDWSFDGFSFVNKDEDGLSIKESKLIYILWEYAKGLEQRIKKLESNV